LRFDLSRIALPDTRYDLFVLGIDLRVMVMDVIHRRLYLIR
jgi:hypothetical protein